MPLKRTQDDMPAINLTPMIDIVFQLIIFFMVGARFTEMERKLDVNVPAVSSKVPLAAAPEKHVINVTKDGHLSFKQLDVTLPQLKGQLRLLKAEQGEPIVVIRCDRKASFEHPAEVMVACREVGITDVNISVKER